MRWWLRPNYWLSLFRQRRQSKSCQPGCTADWLNSRSSVTSMTHISHTGHHLRLNPTTVMLKYSHNKKLVPLDKLSTSKTQMEHRKIFFFCPVLTGFSFWPLPLNFGNFSNHFCPAVLCRGCSSGTCDPRIHAQLLEDFRWKCSSDYNLASSRPGEGRGV